MRAGALAGTLAVLLVARPAHADDAEAIQLRYAAPAECPAEDELVSVALQMGGAFRAARPGEAARSFDVVVQRSDHGFSGSLTVLSSAGEQRERTVSCGRCESVVRALGLFVAMALADGNAPPVAPEPADADRPPAPPADDVEPAQPTMLTAGEPGGVAVMGTWERLTWAPTGVGVMAVAPGTIRLGGVAVASSESRSDLQVDGPARGASLRLGAIASWGAPWSREEHLGFALEAGVLAGFLDATVPAGDLVNGEPVKSWRFVSPYVAGAFVVQLAARPAVRPFVGLGATWTNDYRGDSSGSGSLFAGFAWRSW